MITYSSLKIKFFLYFIVLWFFFFLVPSFKMHGLANFWVDKPNLNGRDRSRPRLLKKKRFRTTVTAKAKRQYVPLDQVFLLVVVYCSLY